MTGTIDTVYKLMAPMLGLSVKEISRAARYCREQGLIPLGKFGPGGGPAPASPQAVASLIIGLMATASRQDAGIESLACGALKTEGGKRCQLTGGTSFVGAMERVLADPAVAAQVEKIAVSRPVAAARIEYNDGEMTTEQKFGRAPATLLWDETVLAGGVVRQIAIDLREIEEETGEWTTP